MEAKLHVISSGDGHEPHGAVWGYVPIHYKGENPVCIILQAKSIFIAQCQSYTQTDLSTGTTLSHGAFLLKLSIFQSFTHWLWITLNFPESLGFHSAK